MSARTEKLKARFKIGSHYAMERFGILFFLVLVMFIVLFIWGGKTKMDRRHEELSSQVLYSSNYMTSKTNVMMTPLAVFANESKSSVVLLMDVGNPGKVGDLAEDYMVALTAQSASGEPEALETRPSVGFYMYESSGYLAVTFQWSESFPRQIIYAMFRNCQDLSGSNVSSGALSEVYDVWTVAFNPGADNVLSTKAFDKDNAFDPDGFYNEIIVDRQEASLRKTLMADVDALESQLNIIDKYEERVRRDGVSVDDSVVPSWRKGDVVVVNKDGSKTFMPSETAVGGYDFDWYNGNVSTGYLKSLMRGSNETSPSKYVAHNKSIATKFDAPTVSSSSSSSSGSSSASFAYDWKLQTGESLEDAAASDTSARMKSTVADVHLLEKAWADYADMKYQYQVTDLTELLELEVSVDSVKGQWTKYTDQDHVTYLDD